MIIKQSGAIKNSQKSANIPPHQGYGAGIAINVGEWVSGWYPAATELNIPKKAYSSEKKIVRC